MKDNNEPPMDLEDLLAIMVPTCDECGSQDIDLHINHGCSNWDEEKNDWSTEVTVHDSELYCNGCEDYTTQGDVSMAAKKT